MGGGVWCKVWASLSPHKNFSFCLKTSKSLLFLMGRGFWYLQVIKFSKFSNHPNLHFPQWGGGVWCKVWGKLESSQKFFILLSTEPFTYRTGQLWTNFQSFYPFLHGQTCRKRKLTPFTCTLVHLFPFLEDPFHIVWTWSLLPSPKKRVNFCHFKI